MEAGGGFDRRFDDALAEVALLDGAELDDAVREAERAVRRAAAWRAAVVERAERTGRFRDDGHRSVRTWYSALTRVAPAEAAAVARDARTLRSMPVLAAAFAAGDVPEGALREVARRHTNPVCARQLPAFDEVLAHWATVLPAVDFAGLMREWERRADPDGSRKGERRADAERGVTWGVVGAEFVLRLSCGSFQGAVLAEVLERFEQQEWQRDRDEAVTRLGRAGVTAADLARTPAQRRLDALFRIFLLADGTELHLGAADDACAHGAPFGCGDRTGPGTGPRTARHAAAPPPDADALEPTLGADAAADGTAGAGDERPPGQAPPRAGPRRGRAGGRGREPLVNVLVDAETFLGAYLELLGHPPPPLDPARLPGWVSRTATGVALDPLDVVLAAVTGRMRVVLRDRAGGTVTGVGRRQRLFRGAAREAALLQHPRCVWPGCTVPASRCEADHLVPHAAGGGTEPANGAPMCDHHNRFKARHLATTTRNADGTWTTRRSDGSRVA